MLEEIKKINNAFPSGNKRQESSKVVILRLSNGEIACTPPEWLVKASQRWVAWDPNQ
jgi:hypothetical protein